MEKHKLAYKKYDMLIEEKDKAERLEFECGWEDYGRDTLPCGCCACCGCSCDDNYDDWDGEDDDLGDREFYDIVVAERREIDDAERIAMEDTE